MSPLSGAIEVVGVGAATRAALGFGVAGVKVIGCDPALRGPGGAAGVGVAGGRFVAFRDQRQMARCRAFLVPHVEVAAGVGVVSDVRSVGRGEVDLLAVRRHVDVLDRVAGRHFVGDCVVDPHVEFAGGRW